MESAEPGRDADLLAVFGLESPLHASDELLMAADYKPLVLPSAIRLAGPAFTGSEEVWAYEGLKSPLTVIRKRDCLAESRQATLVIRYWRGISETLRRSWLSGSYYRFS